MLEAKRFGRIDRVLLSLGLPFDKLLASDIPAELDCHSHVLLQSMELSFSQNDDGIFCVLNKIVGYLVEEELSDNGGVVTAIVTERTARPSRRFVISRHENCFGVTEWRGRIFPPKPDDSPEGFICPDSAD